MALQSLDNLICSSFCRDVVYSMVGDWYKSGNIEGNSKAGTAGITYWPASDALCILELVQDHNIWLKNQTDLTRIW